MPLDSARIRNLFAAFEFKPLFIEELGWNLHEAHLEIQVDGRSFLLSAVAEKCGMVVFVCDPGGDARIPDDQTRRKIERQVTKSAYEHLIVFLDAGKIQQYWLWSRREIGSQPLLRGEWYRRGESGERLAQKIRHLAVTLEEEENLTLPDVTGRARKAFDVERVTKKFYDRFKTEHATFLNFLKGIPDGEMERWYVSVMLNRLMFVYFIQKKGFLDGDTEYLKNKLAQSRRELGKDCYYRDLLCPLFFEGFAKQKGERSEKARKLLGEVPYLNGGIFMPHRIEQFHGETIAIPDKAFEKLFEFFDAYHWHLDERPLKADNEINPDVLGYIFEKYINQKQMGAYYTKEDITGYISQNTVIPFLLDAAREKCRVAFDGERPVWQLLAEDPDRYFYSAMKHGVGLPLPQEIADGLDTAKSGLLERRKTWNKSAPPEYALPTENWREVVARRKQYEEVKGKLTAGEARSINDLITYNLDIRRFAQDVIENAEGPELLVACWKAVEAVTVLDPTCGSGAFLFAALNILDPLYEACLERMRFFLEEWGEDGKKNHPNYLKLFTETLKRVDEHPNRRYFVLKSVIVNNLFGVDIMDEAVEICKLRLFLKLVAQVESAEKIEPLPDIDFNIRAGNTLVGFASLDEVKKTQEGTLGFGKSEVARIEEEAEIADRAFRTFREMQTEQGMSPGDFVEAKEELRSRLKRLTDELDLFLAGQYGINDLKIPNKIKRDEAFAKWRKSHQPFHWFAEFYGILKAGGFDVIIGNPPWAEYSTVKKTYTVCNYKTDACGNLHALFTERSFELRLAGGSFSFIVQLPLANSSRMDKARAVLRNGSGTLYVLPFDDRPGKLFEGLQHCRSVIFVSRRTPGAERTEIFVNGYQRWATEVRAILFQRFAFTRLQGPSMFEGHFPKLSSAIQQAVLAKVSSHSKIILRSALSTRPTKKFIFYQEATGYWVKAVVGLPYYAKNGKIGDPAHGRFLYFEDPDTCRAAVALLNSSLFYAYFIAYGDCFHLSDTLATAFPAPPTLLTIPALVVLGKKLDSDLRANTERMIIRTKGGDKIVYDEFFAWKSKPIIDEIDRVLAEYFGFTEEELDFIINYDIKYRMGQEAVETAEE